MSKNSKEMEDYFLLVSKMTNEELESNIVKLTLKIRKLSFDHEYHFTLVYQRAEMHAKRIICMREWHKLNPDKYIDDLLKGNNCEAVIDKK